MSNLSIYSFTTPKYIPNNYSTNISNTNNKLNTSGVDTVHFSGKTKDKKASGTFADKKFTIDCKETLTTRTMAGTIDNIDFNIKHSGKFLKSDVLSGNTGDKEINLKVKENLFSKNINGTVGDEPVDLKVSDSWSGYKIKGKFKDKDININLNSKFVGYSLESDKMSLRIKNKTLFGNDVNIKGTYNEDPDLIPILIDMVYCLNAEEAIMWLI